MCYFIDGCVNMLLLYYVLKDFELFCNDWIECIYCVALIVLGEFILCARFCCANMMCLNYMYNYLVIVMRYVQLYNIPNHQVH